MILAIDFDQVIHDKLKPVPGRRMGEPLPLAHEIIKKLYRKHTIIVHTVMARTESGKRCVEDWMRYYKIPYHSIEPKIVADLYIDDKAIKFTDWPSTMGQIK